MDILNTKIKSILTEKTTKIIPSNIKKNVNILGVTGTYEGEGSSDYNAKIKPFDSSHRQINTAIQSFEPIDISQITVLTYGFQNLTSLITLPYMDFSHITNASQLCGGDESLINVPELDFSSLTGKNNYNMFSGCVSLSNESLNNILATCITMTNVTNKTLKYIGLSSTQATTCQTLSNWNDFVSAGWTSGY